MLERRPELSSTLRILLSFCAVLAFAAPALLAHNFPPSATFFNQAVALAGWALSAAVAFYAHQRQLTAPWRCSSPAIAALLVMMTGAIGSMAFQRLPSALALSSVTLLMVGILALLMGVFAGSSLIARDAFVAICGALLAAGLCSLAPAIVQVFVPGAADGDWIARASTAGRAGGNLRQPNHLSSLLLWSMAALIWLYEMVAARQPSESLKPWRVATVLLLAALIFGDVLTVSRTGTVCIILLALWGMVDKHLSRFTRILLWLVPVIYIACWFGMSEWMDAQGFAGATQLNKSDPSSSRFGIWSNTIELIKQNPWFGVGWGEFNFAWTLTPFPNRPVAFFDHTHNLPLQLLVELGIPLGTLVLALLAWSLWKAFMACRRAQPPESLMVRTAFVMVLMMVVHSMLEYPLWYAYFLLPTAFMLGICVGHGEPVTEAEAATRPASPWLRRSLIGASLVLVLGTVYSVFDYLKVAAIFSADEDTPLSYRIREGQKSTFFAHHADYAAATTAEHPSTQMAAFRRAPHFLLDTRLMLAWAKAYAEKGDVERARYIAARLREFRNPDSAEFFAECDAPRAPGQPAPFQCAPPTRSFTYQDFKLRE